MWTSAATSLPKHVEGRARAGLDPLDDPFDACLRAQDGGVDSHVVDVVVVDDVVVAAGLPRKTIASGDLTFLDDVERRGDADEDDIDGGKLLEVAVEPGRLEDHIVDD